MFCTSCGTKNVADSNFCKQCGSKVEKLLSPRINQEDLQRALPDEEQMNALLEHAYALRKEGNYDGAIALCVEALHLPMESTSAHSLLGQIYEEKGDRAAAIREYERVLILNPGSIADRVKLDELRNETTPGPRRPHPHITLNGQQKVPVSHAARFTNVGITAALIMLGGLLALQFRPHSEKTVPVASALNGTAANSNLTAASSSTPNAGKTSGTMTGTQQGNQPNMSAGPGQQIASNSPSATSPSFTFPPSLTTNSALPPANAGPQMNYRQAPEIRYVPVQATPSQAPPTTQNANGISLANKSDVKRGRTAANSSKTPHIVLPGDADAADGAGNITVSVGDKDFADKSNGDKSNGKDKPVKSSGKANGVDAGYASIEVDKTHSKSGTAVAGSPTGETLSMMAVGEEKKNQHDYKGAIAAYTRALANAGNQAGYLWQQRALCFQNLNDLSSAKTDFQHAIDEYHKLETSDPETAWNGIRACEQSIKTCNN